MPVSSPSKVITTGNRNGVIVSRMPAIIAPLIMLPNRRTASASVREASPMMLKGSIRMVGSRYDLR